MAFRESAEREVLLQQEEEYAAELDVLEKREAGLLVSAEDEQQVLVLTRERDQLKREIVELTERRQSLVQAGRESDRRASTLLLGFSFYFVMIAMGGAIAGLSYCSK